MFTRLVQKELLQYLLDLRFVAVFAICTLLAALSVYVGSQNYTRQLQAHASAAASYRQAWKTFLDDNNLFAFQGYGYRWNAKPEVLSPIAYGLSGQIGQEANIHYRIPPKFEASLFEEDPVYGLFGVLDLSFIVKIVLSLCVLLSTYDAICGEKEAGTLRLYASFPVPRSSLALAKLVGSTVAVILPFVFAYLLASTVLAFFPGIELKAEDWLRMVALMVAFALYLMVFAAFGPWISAVTQRKMTAFLSLLGLWAVWVFLLPNLTVHTINRLVPVESPVALQKRADELFWDMRLKRYAEMAAYWASVNQGSQEAVSEEEQKARLAGA